MPISLTPRRRFFIETFLRDQVLGAAAAQSRSSRIEMWRSFMRRYEAKTKPKHWPFRNASSLHIPFAATAVDSIKTRVKTALKSGDKLIVAEPLIEEKIEGALDPDTGDPYTWRDISELLEEYMLYETGPSGDVNLKRAIDELLDEITLFGTGFLKTIWDTCVERDYNDDSTFTDHTTYNNVRFLVPALEDIFFPPNYPDLDRIPWITQRYLARP